MKLILFIVSLRIVRLLLSSSIDLPGIPDTSFLLYLGRTNSTHTYIWTSRRPLSRRVRFLPWHTWSWLRIRIRSWSSAWYRAWYRAWCRAW